VRIVWTLEAERDRAAIWDYLAARDPAAALKIDRLFGEVVARLAEFPLLGHEGPVAGTRELKPIAATASSTRSPTRPCGSWF